MSRQSQECGNQNGEKPLVSIIIPCFNAERWLAEAIDSCLAQTYGALEVIVIDDGSTDRSLEVIKSFGDKIRWETGPNCGGNHARNRGLKLSRGDYIQYLDADDYLLPEKVSRQVNFLESSGADIVYEDWRHQHDTDSGETVGMGDVVTSGMHDDLLEMLLRGWWVSSCALLVRRRAVEAIGGWDEALRAAQDRDFFISLMLSGARAVYRPGCYSVYRRHGKTTVSAGNRQRWLNNHARVLDKALNALRSTDRLTERYRNALARSYFALAQNYYDRDRVAFDRLIGQVLSLEPNFTVSHSRLYAFAQRVLGIHVAEALASWKRNRNGVRRS